MDRLVQNLRQATRRLSRSPGFTLVAILSLALGIGANTAIYSLVNKVLLTPLPFDEPDRLVGVWHTAPGLGYEDVNQSPALHFTYEDDGQFFEEIGMWDNTQVSITGLEEPEEVEGMRVTDGTFRALRIQPVLGRRFTREDDSPNTPETVILGYPYWQSRFGGDPGVIGRTLQIGGRTTEIIGVMGPDFRFLQFDPAVYLPMRFDRAELVLSDFSYQGLARLRPGVTLEQANAEVDRLIPISVEKFPGGISMEMLEQSRFAATLHPLIEDVVGDIGQVLWVLLGTVGIVLLVACANVANLFLVRAEGRDREVAVRSAMGAGRGQVAGQFLTESLVLGVLGGVAGLGVAYGGLRLLLATTPANIPRFEAVSLGPDVLLFTVVISVLAGLFFGLFPVVRYRRFHLVNALKEGGRGGSAGRERHRVRNTLVVAQMALALILLVGSGLMIRSYQALRNVEPGFRSPEEVMTLRLYIPPAEVEDDEQAALTHELIASRIEGISGVTSVGLTSSITMDGWDSNNPVFIEDFPVPEGQIAPIRRFKWVGEGYFETMQNPVVAGRAIDMADIRDHNPVVMITENLAREYWDSPADALGKRVSTGLSPGTSGWREIVGVVGDVRDDGLSQEPTPTTYWPMVTPSPWTELADDEPVEARRSMAYVIRSPRAGSADFFREIREAIWAVNPNLPLANTRTLEEIQERSLARTSFTLVMLGIAASVALLLGAIGIYGVIAYVVSQRTREIGVRLAVGAASTDVTRMVLRQGFFLAGVGVVVGLASAFALTRLMSALLYGVSPLDPVTFATVALLLTSVALLASYLPARRAATTDPVEALRAE